MHPLLLSTLALTRGAIETVGLPIAPYSLLLSSAAVIGWWATQREAKRANLDERLIAQTTLVTLFSALFASRIGYLLLFSDEAFSLRASAALFRGGLFGYGAIFGGVAAAWWWLRSRDLRFVDWLDAATPGFVFATILVRAGCYLEGCDYGIPLSVDAVESDFGWNQHPTQLYEMFGSLVLAGWLVMAQPAQRFAGQRAMSALFGYAVLRVVVEFWRADLPRGLLGPEIERSIALGLSLLILGSAFAFGPALSLRSGALRLSLAALLPVSGLLVLWGGRAASASLLQLSATQWLALGSALFVAWIWQSLRDRSGPRQMESQEVSNRTAPCPTLGHEQSNPSSPRSQPQFPSS